MQTDATPSSPRPRRRVARRILALFVLCSLAPLLVLALYADLEVTRHLTDEAYARQGRVTRSEGMQILRGLQALGVEVEWLAALDVPDPAESSLAARLLRRRTEHVLPVGVFTLGEAPTVGGRELSLSDGQVDHLRSGQTLVFGARGPESEGVELYMARRLAGGTPHEALLCAVEGDDLWGFYTGVEDEGDVRAYFCEDDLVAASDPRRVPDLPVRPSEANGSRFRFEWTAGDERYLSTARKLFTLPTYGTNFTVVVAEPEQSVLASVTQFKRVFWLICLATFLVAGFLSLRHVRTTLGPLEALHAAVRRFGDSEQVDPVEIRTGDELEDLGEGFNEMVVRVRDRTRELQEALQAKSQFLANMSHELRTPMTSILGYADMIANEPLDENERRAYAATIVTSGQHLLDLVGEILDLSKLKERGLSLSPVDVDLGELLERVLDITRAGALKKGLELTLTRDPDLPRRAVLDPKRLTQVLVNVVGNAIKFTDAGRVELEARLSDDERTLLFAVTDTGIGIAPEDQSLIFAPFAQVDSRMTRQKGGTGLGLSIARELVRRMGGDITCRSEPGRGSRFEVVVGYEPGRALPAEAGTDDARRQDPAPEAVSAVGPGATPRRSPRVLVVEDVAVNRLLLQTMVRSVGASVEGVENGREAVDTVLEARDAGRPFDLVLMDMQMPVLDGYGATRELREEGYSGSIVALTAHANEGERERCLEAGCDEFANKPISKSDLAELVTRFAGSTRDGASAA